MARYEFWVHGVATIVEYPERALEIRHAGWGTLVRQEAGRDNWFHLAIPTGKIIDSQAARIREVRFKGQTNENARVDLVQFRDDHNIILSQSVSFTDQIIDEIFQSPDTLIEGGITFCVHVLFLTGEPVGEIIFRSAGAAFLI